MLIGSGTHGGFDDRLRHFIVRLAAMAAGIPGILCSLWAKIMSVTLDEPRNRNRFLRIIADGQNTNILSDWEHEFLRDMKRYYDERDETQRLIGTPWNPSVKQWNTLTGIERKLCR